MSDLTADRIRLILDYDPKTGIFTWRWRPAYDFKAPNAHASYLSRFAGRRAGTPWKTGYRGIKIGTKRIGEHRLAWLYCHGYLPDQVDHENGVVDDNRLGNLRDVDQVGNSRNQKLRSTNTSGVTGVRLESKRGRKPKWTSYIYVRGLQIRLGRFDDFDSAVSARKAAELAHGFHPNHGRKM